MAAFKAGEVDLLVATDVAARGLDIADLPAVFNFDVPFNAEDYVHRIGRTGRAGASGLAVTLVTRNDARLVADIEKLIKKKIELDALELDDDRPRRRPPMREDDRGASRPEGRPAAAAYAGASAPRRHEPRSAPRDPFFDKPYEPAAPTDGPAAWEKSAPSTPTPSRLSPNIRAKRKVAALLGGTAKA